jgi:hypothetical protein
VVEVCVDESELFAVIKRAQPCPDTDPGEGSTLKASVGYLRHVRQPELSVADELHPAPVVEDGVVLTVLLPQSKDDGVASLTHPAIVGKVGS